MEPHTAKATITSGPREKKDRLGRVRACVLQMGIVTGDRPVSSLQIWHCREKMGQTSQGQERKVNDQCDKVNASKGNDGKAGQPL